MTTPAPPSQARWRAFWDRVFSLQTARFILAQQALALAGAGAYVLLYGHGESNGASEFIVGQLFALATMAFGYYYGSTARNDERPRETQIVTPPALPVLTAEEKHDGPHEAG